MNNFGPRKSTNPGLRGKGLAQGNPSGLVAVLILGAAVYFHVGESGKLDGLLAKYLPAAVKKSENSEQELTPEARAAKRAEEIRKATPTALEFIRDVKAYDSAENGNFIGTIESGTVLSIIDFKKNQKGVPYAVQVRSNGMKLWVKIPGTRYKFEG
tara:strand:- start:2208 stop:2675 length:468 start_codon:yes stop_codon:yes gene_type:complete